MGFGVFSGWVPGRLNTLKVGPIGSRRGVKAGLDLGGCLPLAGAGVKTLEKTFGLAGFSLKTGGGFDVRRGTPAFSLGCRGAGVLGSVLDAAASLSTKTWNWRYGISSFVLSVIQNQVPWG